MNAAGKVLAWLASIRLRVFFRVIFLLLAVATVALALAVLQEEKQQGFDNYREGFAKTADQVAARLHHPAGQLALLNPESGACCCHMPRWISTIRTKCAWQSRCRAAWCSIRVMQHCA